MLKLLPVNIFSFIIVLAPTCQYSFKVFKCKQLSWYKNLATTIESEYNASMKIIKVLSEVQHIQENKVPE